jgi:hypothetical protein
MALTENTYSQFEIKDYILKITGVFNYDKKLLKKAESSGYKKIEFSEKELSFNKDYFYPDLRKQFFSDDKKRHPIVVKEIFENSIVDLFSKTHTGDISKQIQLKITDSRLDLFDNGFGMFTLNLKINEDNIDLNTFSDATFLARNFETFIVHTVYKHWFEFIDNEILLGSKTRGESSTVDDYSGTKYKLFTVLDVPELQNKENIQSLLFDIGTVSKVGSAIGTTYDSMDRNYIKKLLDNNTISIYNNWEALALLDTFTIVGNGILEKDYMHDTYHKVYHIIYLYCLFIKYSLSKFNFEVTDLDEDRRKYFQDFISKYYYNYISYNFLPMELFNKIKVALDIDKERTQLTQQIVAVGQKIQEEQQDRTNKILGIVTVLTSLSSMQSVYDFLLTVQQWLGWSTEIYWTIAIMLTLVIGGGIGFYVFGNTILKWFKKRK